MYIMSVRNVLFNRVRMPPINLCTRTPCPSDFTIKLRTCSYVFVLNACSFIFYNDSYTAMVLVRHYLDLNIHMNANVPPTLICASYLKVL